MPEKKYFLLRGLVFAHPRTTEGVSSVSVALSAAEVVMGNRWMDGEASTLESNLTPTRCLPGRASAHGHTESRSVTRKKKLIFSIV